MPERLTAPISVLNSTAASFIEAAIENDNGSSAVRAEETMEPAIYRREEPRGRQRARVGEVRAVMKTLGSRNATDSALRSGNQGALVRQLEAELRRRENHRRDMARTLPVAKLAQAQAVLDSVAAPGQLKTLALQTQQLTQHFMARLTPDRGSHALAQLNEATASPAARFAVMQLARASLAEQGFAAEASQLDDAIADVYRDHGEEIRVASNTAASAALMYESHDEREKFQKFYVQTLDAELTPRYLFDGLLELGGIENLDLTASTMGQALRDDMLAVRTSVPRDQLSRMYSYLSLFNNMQVARSMLANARDFVMPAKGLDQTASVGTQKMVDLCRDFFTLGYASVPGPVIDRITEKVGAKKQSPARTSALHRLYKNMATWPPQVWASDEAIDGAKKQMLKRLDQSFEAQRRDALYGADMAKRYLAGGNEITGGNDLAGGKG